MVRLTGTHNSERGDNFKVEIIDKSGSGSNGIFTFRGNGYSVDPHGPPRDPHKRFNPSKCSFTMLMDPDNTAHSSFVDDLKNAPENRFFIKAFQNGELDFAGPIKMDAVTFEDVPFVFDFKIVASDGISGTAGIDYSDNGGAYSGRQTYLEHIINILGKIGVDFLYGSDDALTVVCNWYANEMSGVGSVNPWELCNVDHEVFITRGEDGTADFMKSIDVLDELLKPFHACIRYGNGRFWIEQITERVNATFIGYTYTIDGTLKHVKTYNLDTQIEQNKVNHTQSKFSLRGRQYSFLPALKQINISVKYKEELTKLTKDVEWSHSSADVCGPDEFIQPVPTSMYVRVKGTVRIKTTIDPVELANNGFKTHRYYFKMRIKIFRSSGGGPETHHYERLIDHLDFYNIKEKFAKWDDSGIKFVEFASPVVSEFNDGTNIYFPLVFETKVLDMTGFNSLVRTLCFESDGISDENGNLLDPLNYDLEWAFENVEIAVVDANAAEGKAKSKIKKFKGTGDENNTAIVNLDTILGDNLSTQHSILVFNGSEFVQPTGWGVAGSGSHPGIIELLIDEILSLRTKPLEVANMTILGDGFEVSTIARVTWQGINYLFDIGSKISRSNFLKGSFFGLSKAPVTSTLQIVTLVEQIDVLGFQKNDGSKIDIPPKDNEGISKISEAITEGSTVASLKIPAALYNYFRIGDVIEIRDPNTGNKQTFTVAADVNQGDTEITVNSSTAAFSFGLESKVIFDWAYESGQTYNETKERYEFFSVDTGNVTEGATLLTITEFTVPAVSAPIDTARKRLRPERNGVKMRMIENVATYTGDQPLRVFERLPDTNQIKLHATAPVGPWDEFDIYGFEIVK